MKKILVCLTLLTSMVFGLGIVSNKPISEGASDLMYNSKGISLRTRNILRANPEGEVRTNEASLLASKLGVQVGTTSDGKKAMRFVVATSSNDVTVTFNRTLTLESGTVSEKLFTAATYYDAVQISGENTLTPDAWNNQYENADYKYFYCYTMKGITQDYASLGVVATVTDNNDETNTHSSYNIANIAGYNGSVDESFSGIKLDSNKDGSVVINGVTYTYNKTTDKINAFTSISTNPETLEVLEGNLVRKVEVVYKQITVNDAEITNVDGKAILNLKGTYSDNATAEEVLALKPVFNLKQNKIAGSSGWNVVYEDKTGGKCTLNASEGNWVCSYDISSVDADKYIMHFSLEGRVIAEGEQNEGQPYDCKLENDITKDYALTNNKSYKLLNYPGETTGDKYYGNIGLVISDKTALSNKKNADVCASPDEWAYFSSDSSTDMGTTGIYDDLIVFNVPNPSSTKGTYQLRYQPSGTAGKYFAVTFEAKVEGAEYFVFGSDSKSSKSYSGATKLDDGYIRIKYFYTITDGKPFSISPKGFTVGNDMKIAIRNFRIVVEDEGTLETPIEKKTNADICANPDVWAYTSNLEQTYTSTSGVYSDGTIRLVVTSGASTDKTYQLRYQPDFAVGTKYTATFDVKLVGGDCFKFGGNNESFTSTEYDGIEDLGNGYVRVTYNGTVGESMPFMVQPKDHNTTFVLIIANFSVVEKA